MEAQGNSQGTWTLLFPLDAYRKYSDFKLVTPGEAPGIPACSPPTQRWSESQPYPCQEPQTMGRKQTAPLQNLWSQLHRQGRGIAKKHLVLLPFKHLTFPWPLLQRLTSNSLGAAGCLPSQDILKNISTLATWAGHHVQTLKHVHW